MLPSTADVQTLHKNLSTHVSRVLTTHLPFFKASFSDVTISHIPNVQQKEMSLKSEVVSIIVYACVKAKYVYSTIGTTGCFAQE